jgi:hypothetical protein
MKRTMLITVVFCVPVASFLIFTADSFSESIVVKQDGLINGLVFTFDPALVVDLPGLGNVTVGNIVIKATGKEHIVITPSKQYNYDAKFEGSSSDGQDFILDGTPQPIKLISGSLSESFKIQAVLLTSIDPNKILVPVEVNLFFKSTLSTKDKDGNVYTFSLDLKLKHGDVQFIK